MFLTAADFTGKYKIAKDCFSKTELDLYIIKYESFYLKDLLGCELYDLFVADLTIIDPIIPQTQKFLDIFDSFCKDDACGVMYRSEGILEMLKGFVYYHYVLDQGFKNTMIGTVNNTAAFSKNVSSAMSTIEDRYNLAADSYISIQLFMVDNSDIYPEFNGVKKKLSFFGGSF